MYLLRLVWQEEADELRKKVAVLECQLRKSEAAKKSFEMSTLKLLSFVEVTSHGDDERVEGFSSLEQSERRKEEQEVSASAVTHNQRPFQTVLLF